MKKLTRKEAAKINGSVGIGQCIYTDPETGHSKLGCLFRPVPDCCGGWTYPTPGQECQPCR